jgi:hypothetical protein
MLVAARFTQAIHSTFGSWLRHEQMIVSIDQDAGAFDHGKNESTDNS